MNPLPLRRLPAVTVWQPWAWLIAAGIKQVETRDWAPAYRGPIVIHAAAVPKERAAEFQAQCADVEDTLALLDLPGLPERLPVGGAVAIADLVEVLESRGHGDDRFSEVDHELGNLAAGRMGWVFGEVRPLCPAVRVRGDRGLWYIPASLDERIRRAFELARPVSRAEARVEVQVEHQLDLFGGT
jgi:hypothetical protein